MDAVLPETSDVAALTRRLMKDDEMAYRIFYYAYFDRLSRYLLVVTAGDEDATREALQGTLMRVVRHIRIFNDETVFWSWLTVLARSALSDENRKRRRYLAFLDRFKRHADVALTIQDEPPSEGRLVDILERNLTFLSAEERALIEGKYFDRQSVREIAARLQTTGKAVESRLMRIRGKLKQAVLAELKNESPD